MDREHQHRQGNEDASPFVYLGYAPRSSGATNGISLLVIQKGLALEVVIRHDWRKGLESEDGEYLAELMDDWRRTIPAKIPALLESLSQLSIGPLRTLESGLLDPARKSALIQKVAVAPLHGTVL